jgi:hypothetical protein
MAGEVPLTTRITPSVDRRLRMLALIQRRHLNDVLTSLLDQALPSAAELAGQLHESPSATGAVA